MFAGIQRVMRLRAGKRSDTNILYQQQAFTKPASFNTPTIV